MLDRIFSSAVLATWGSYAGRTLNVVALAPFVLSAFSADQAAVWYVTITLLQMQLIVETNLAATFIRAIGFALGGATQLRDHRVNDIAPEANPSAQSPNWPLLSSIWTSMRLLYVAAAAVTLTLIAILAFWSAAPTIERLADQAPAWNALLIMIAGATIRAYGGLHIAYLYGCNAIAPLRWMEAIFWTASFIACVITLLLGGDLFHLSLAYQLPLMANLVANVWLCRKLQGSQHKLDRHHAYDHDVVKQLWPSFWRSNVGTTIYMVVTQGAGLYFARVAESASTAQYLLALSLMRPMIQFAQVPFITKLPTLARLRAQGDMASQVSISQRSMHHSYWTLVAIALLIAVAAPVLLSLVDNEVGFVSPSLWALICFTAFIERIGAMHLQLYSTTNHIVWHWANGVTGILFLGIAWLLFPAIGVFGFMAAQSLAILIFYIPYSVRYSYPAFKLPFPEYEWRTSVLPTAVMVIYLAAAFTLID